MKKYLYGMFIIMFSLIGGRLMGQELGFQEPEKLSENINSEMEEIQPVFSPDGNRMYFVRAMSEDNFGGEFSGHDIWISYRDNTGNWSEAQNNFPKWNNDLNNAIIGISEDGQGIYLLDTYSNKKGKPKGIAKTFTFMQETELINIQPIKGLKSKNGFLGIHITPKEDVVLISMQGRDAIGEEDLYVCLKTSSGWSDPINLGPMINTRGFEISPFLADDGKTLYFSSDYHLGYGDGDIFVSKRLDESWTHWTEPVNLGQNINTEFFEGYFVINNRQEAFFSSNREGVFSDIFVSKIISKEDKGLLTASIEGISDDIIFREKPNESVNEKELSVINDENVENSVKSEEEEAEYKPLNLKDGSISIVGRIKDDKLQPRLIFFDFDSFRLKAESIKTLDQLIVELQELKDVKINVLGHTDDIGDMNYNQWLSEQRALSVRNYMLEAGISEKVLNIVEGKGENEPVKLNTTLEGREFNRRVLIEEGNK
ncbi:OmpA family protein [Xanthovirga aplysinae]|uniref:OmpA family protein n=1 Tax=Xanthovirga aplysinae TaxID=2529853 RepID=UPI0016572E73|nr:OmpA family protein [Xanthovirga aplysinae]